MTEFFEHVKNKFANFDFFADTVQIIVLAVMVCFVLIYAKNHNAKSFSFLIIGYYVILCVLAAFKVFSAGMLLVLICLPALLLVVLFASELKRDVFKISWRKHGSHQSFVEPEEIVNTIHSIVKAAQNLSKKDTGALIIIVPDNISAHILESGTALKADVSTALLESIFYKGTPLHDGAVVIKGNKILAAACYLPLSQSTNIPKELGTRHRSALGLTENNPSVTAIVVSEETGIISAVHDGKMMRYLDAKRLEEVLNAAYMLEGAKAVWRTGIDESV